MLAFRFAKGLIKFPFVFARVATKYTIFGTGLFTISAFVYDNSYYFVQREINQVQPVNL